MTAWSRREVIGVLVGAAAVAATTWIRLALAPVAGSDMALVFYILAVLLAAGVGGAVGGLATTLLSIGAGIAFIIGLRSLAGSLSEWIRVAVFALEGIAISLTVEQLQRRTKSLRQVAMELDAERHRNEKLALEDGLTSLGNRRAFERDLERALAQASRHGASLTVAFADVDGLKHTNDTLGHAAGDALLVGVAAALRKGCRASDEGYRLSGDEFALLLPDAGREEFETLGRRLHELITEMNPRFPGVGVSIGAAHVPDDGSEAETLLRLADARMYAMKVNRSRSIPASESSR